ncbi:hypothetical protein C8J57DRAFT_1300113 [Mycena rebaudengoi]|nr:hypothetical protein C8J57DRAFT_1300113 [Mycena rebaudengoi]
MHALSKFVAEHLSPEPSLAVLVLQLARGSARLLKDMATGQKPSYYARRWKLWGYFVRSSAHSPELLQDIREFLSFETFLYVGADEPDNIHSIIQWLKTFPDPPLDLINIWEGYLMDACIVYSDMEEEDENKSLEKRWRAWQTDTSRWLPHYHHLMFQQDH